MLVHLKNSLAKLVKVSSKAMSICNRFYAKLVDISKNLAFRRSTRI